MYIRQYVSFFFVCDHVVLGKVIYTDILQLTLKVSMYRVSKKCNIVNKEVTTELHSFIYCVKIVIHLFLLSRLKIFKMSLWHPGEHI